MVDYLTIIGLKTEGAGDGCMNDTPEDVWTENRGASGMVGRCTGARPKAARVRAKGLESGKKARGSGVRERRIISRLCGKGGANATRDGQYDQETNSAASTGGTTKTLAVIGDNIDIMVSRFRHSNNQRWR